MKVDRHIRRRINKPRKQLSNVTRRVLLHQHPLQISKWTVYQDACWKQEESYQSHHSLSYSLPKSWRSSRIKEKKAQLTTSPALFSSWYTQLSVDLLHCCPFSTEKLPHNLFYCSFIANKPTKRNSLLVSTFLCCISTINLTENSRKVMYHSVTFCVPSPFPGRWGTDLVTLPVFLPCLLLSAWARSVWNSTEIKKMLQKLQLHLQLGLWLMKEKRNLEEGRNIDCTHKYTHTHKQWVVEVCAHFVMSSENSEIYCVYRGKKHCVH